jgi:3-methyladenine DNA glycosylase AlkD
MVMKLTPEQEEALNQVYLGLKTTAEISEKALKELSESIKHAMGELLDSDYKRNAGLQRMVAENPMNPMFPQKANDHLKPIVERLQDIHQEIAHTNDEMKQVKETLDILHGQPNPSVKKNIDQQLSKLSQVNETYTQSFEELQKQAMVLGDVHLAKNVTTPDQIQALDNRLKDFHEQVKDLRAKAVDKRTAVQEMKQETESERKPRI